LVSTYTPIRTDEQDVSVDHVLFGGLNVYLQQKVPLLRFLPAAMDRFLDNPTLIRRVTEKAMNTDPKTLGKLAVSMLKGTLGNQRKEVFQMVKWLELAKPDVLIFTNALIGGCIPELKRQLNVPVIVTLQGDDVFLDSLLPKFRQRCLDLIKTNSEHVDGFIVHSEFYRDYMADYFSIDHDGDGEISENESFASNRPFRVGDEMFQVTGVDKENLKLTIQKIAAPLSGTIVGRKCPPFEFTTVDGKKITDQSILGKVTFLDVWAVT